MRITNPLNTLFTSQGSLAFSVLIIARCTSLTLLLLFSICVNAQQIADEETLQNASNETHSNTLATEEVTPATQLTVPIAYADPQLAKQHQWLNTGETKLSALYLKQTRDVIYGAVLLIPDLMSHPSKASNVNSLRNALSQSHWQSLALDLTSIDNFDEQHVNDAIGAGTAFLNEKGILNIAIIAEGIGAAQAVNYLADLTAKAQLQSIKALVLINAKNSIPRSKEGTLEKLKAIKLPILDAFSANDNLYQQLANDRKTARNETRGQYSYRQITLPRAVNYYNKHENHITKRIRGWLDKNISGFTVRQN